MIVDIEFLLSILKADDQETKYVKPFQRALEELQAAREVIRVAKNNTGDVYDLSSNFLHRVNDKIRQYYEVTGTGGEK